MDKEDDKGLMLATGLLTFAAALGVSGGTNLVMMLTKNDLIKKHRPTLTFRSAIFGDGLILPVVNMLMMNSLKKWRPHLSGRTAIAPTLGGSAIALLFHVAQGKNGMVNWTMTRPWRWNLLGYYHFIYMATQFSYMLLYLTQLAGRWRSEEISADQKRDLAIIGANMAAFGVLLATDYA